MRTPDPRLCLAPSSEHDSIIMQDGKLSDGNYYNHSLNFENNTVLLNNVNVNGLKATCPEKSKLS